MAVTASCRSSETSITVPVAARKPSTNSRCASVTPAPIDAAAIPFPTKVGVFGITRITGLLVPRQLLINEIVLPAAKVITTAFGLIDPLISSRTVAISCGFTTNKSAPAPETLTLRSAALIEYFEISSCARSSRFSEIVMRSGLTPDEIKAAIRASPITPAPITATFDC